MKKTFKFIKGRQFLPEYCKILYTSWTKHKMNGKGDKGRPVRWTEDELKAIKKGFDKMCKDINSEIEKEMCDLKK